MTSWIWSLLTDLAGDVSFSTLRRNIRGHFRGHLLTPEGKINDIIITGNNKITLTQPTLERSPPFYPLTSPADFQTITFPWTSPSCLVDVWLKSLREGQDRVKGERSPHSEAPQKIWLVLFLVLQTALKHSFIRLLLNYRLSRPSRVTIVAGLGGLVNTTGVRRNVCSGYSQKMHFQRA